MSMACGWVCRGMRLAMASGSTWAMSDGIAVGFAVGLSDGMALGMAEVALG